MGESLLLEPSLAQTLAVSAAKTSKLSLSASTQHSLAAWIKDNIRKKECCFYVDGDSKGICKCGYQRIHHVDDSIKPENYLGETWDRHRHVHEVPTDAYGDIWFGGLGQKIGKYVRVSSDTSPDLLYQLLTEQWKLPPPNLLISVTGGAKNFYMKPHLTALFRRGLIKVAQTTGAWIITGGTHAGVMKHVGQAVREHVLSSGSMEGQIVAIGVATWGAIHNRRPLVHLEGRFPAHYSLDMQSQGHLSCLDNNHSHFLLVDDGTHGCYGVEIELCSRLERLISQQPLGNRESGVRIPVVCVVLNGGPGTLSTIYGAMLNRTPCVVLEGSGRLADVLAHVAGLPVTKVTLSVVHQLMKRFFGLEYESFTELKIIEWTKKIQDIIRMPQLLTVFRMSEDNHGDVDVAILQALLKANRSSESVGMERWERQLELAVAWNRVDIAKTDIFTEDSQWKSSDLHQAMFSALLGHKPQFVRLLLENGVCLREFLGDQTTLCDLYTQLPTSCFFPRRLAKRIQTEKSRRSQTLSPRGAAGRTISLSHVSDEIRHLLGSFTQPLYPLPGLHSTRYPKEPKEDVAVTLPPKEQLELQASPDPDRGPGRDSERGEETFRDPGRDLFLWAILQNQKELAEIAWEQSRDCTSAALAASKILKKLAEEGAEEEDEAEEMRELAKHYERHAIGVFNKCHCCDEERAQRLLIRISSSWGQTTCLRLALEADDKSFVAHSGVQALLTQIWCGELAADNPLWRVLLCMLFFPLIYTGFLGFRRDESIQREAERSAELLTMESLTGSQACTRRKYPVHDLPARNPLGLKPLTVSTRLVSLFTSPQVKFYWNILSYFSFLLLFSVVLMIDFQTTPSWREGLLYVWLISLICEEVRQLFHDPDGFGFRKKADMYINDMWNILDFLSILLFIIGLAFRLTTRLFYAGKVILCIDFIIFCLRLMAIFIISKTLGPKIIIVRRMMLDMFFFMFLLSIWVVAYGVAKQGILIHNEDRLDWIVRGVIYEPYLIIFGNMPSNIDNALFDIKACSVNGTESQKPKCPILNEDKMPAFPEWLTIILLCVYLLFANILLLNLLIAIFNYTFQEVQDNTDTIWKFQRYELIKEYHSRPAAPPPLILLSHIFLFIRRIVLQRPPNSYRAFKERLPEVEEEELLSWESFMKDNYLLSCRQQQSQSMEQRTADTANKVCTITELLQREEATGSVALVKRLTRLEEQVSQSARALQWIMDTLKAQGLHSKEEAPQLASPGKLKRSESEPNEPHRQEKTEREKTFYHVNARRLDYPDSTIPRFPVLEEKVPWEVDFILYNPPVLNGDSQDQTDGSEPDSVKRYRNPGGRTGMKGRGALTCLGPNLILDPVLTRWRDSERSALEFLAVWDQEDGLWTLPGGPVQSDEPLPDRLLRIMGQKIYDRIKTKVVEVTKVHEGYVDDVRNTDDAWVETTVLNIHLDRRSLLMADINRMAENTVGCVELVRWTEVSSRTRMCSYQRDALRRVAELHQRTF
ncbi:transient receptor potential cation channel subfamily M member 2 isoform X2 [Oncorhynchus nerka]|uniref:transient receptor potential cation channel subfamily M member 2 isoform X2 n=1 Tax=Oncorhynchus nerka TaxID=8023 RepID=UPI0031B88654